MHELQFLIKKKLFLCDVYMQFIIPGTGAKQCLWENIIIRRQFIFQLAVVPNG
jgi:hypothetical protein